MNGFELVAPSAYYNAGGWSSTDSRPSRPYIALVPVSRYDDGDPDPAAPLRAAQRPPEPDHAKVSAALARRENGPQK
jgi:hypothetical protein